MKTIKFYTIGCKVNQYETQSIREQFTKAGFEEREDNEPSDLYVINTCTVTHKADYDSLGFIRKAKRENPKAKIVVTGCLTELDADRIKAIDGMSIIVKNKDKEDILKHLSQLHPRTRAPAHPRTINGISYFKAHTRAFLKIQDGCNNLCSYCKVPLVRGMSHSKPINAVFQEASSLVKNGIKEIVLCGICLGAYGTDFVPEVGLTDVIDALEQIDGLLRIRLSSIEAGDVSDKLINKMAASKKLCRHLHIPVQSGDNAILEKMNRRYSRADYINLVRKIKNKIPSISITTDVLVGFPDESVENFQNTANLIKDILPLKVHVFPYSKRAGTLAAARFNRGLGLKIIKERIACMRLLSADCSFAYRKQFLGKEMDVLIEGRYKGKANYWQGYTDNYIKILVKSNFDLKNKVINLKIKKLVKDFALAE